MTRLNNSETSPDSVPNIKKYGVFFIRHGYAEVEAESAEAAMKLADETLKHDDVNWDDDWLCVDAQPLEDIYP